MAIVSISDLETEISKIATLERKSQFLFLLAQNAMTAYNRRAITESEYNSIISSVLEIFKIIKPATEREMHEGNILKIHLKLHMGPVLTARVLKNQYVVEYLNEVGDKYVARHYWSNKANRFGRVNVKKIGGVSDD